jgi:UDP-N-acetyl-D-galactosamine dehydrogenase
LKNTKEAVVAVVGLGYVGMPLALAFGRTDLKCYGFDVNAERVAQLKQGLDSSGEVDESAIKASAVYFTTDEADLKQANFIIVAVPTPVNADNQPDLTIVEKASELIGRNLQPGSIVVYESTVYPGATEEICVPILERASGLVCGKDFKVGYSPERINPGDSEHTLERVVKIVAAQDEESTAAVAAVYEKVCQAGVYIAATIKTAEAAKVIENTQRDLNIALMNELSMMFHGMGIDTADVLKAAGTKWNFHHYKPGLVGGHCIGVDPYYLIYKAKQSGYEPQLITAARKINDGMDEYVARSATEMLAKVGKAIAGSRLLVLGLTFKPDVKDTRNARIAHVIKQLQEQGVVIDGYDPLLSEEELRSAYDISPVATLDDISEVYDGLIVAAPHEEILRQSDAIINYISDNTFVIDIAGGVRKDVAPNTANYWSL